MTMNTLGDDKKLAAGVFVLYRLVFPAELYSSPFTDLCEDCHRLILSTYPKPQPSGWGR